MAADRRPLPLLGFGSWRLRAYLAVEFLIHDLAQLRCCARGLFTQLDFFYLLAAMTSLGTEARAMLVDFLAFDELDQLAMLLNLGLGCVFVMSAVQVLCVPGVLAWPWVASLAGIEGRLSRI